MIHAGWARCGVLATVAWPLWGCGGWVDVETTKAGDVASKGGSAGAPPETPGAPTQTDPRYSFYVLSGVVEEGEDATQLNIIAREVSDNGALVVGTSAAVAMLPPGLPETEDTSYVVGSRGFYWTAAGGSRPWPHDYHSPWLSGDGSSVFTFDRPAYGGSILTYGRWTQAGGFQAIAEPTDTPHDFYSCSADGKRAAGYTGAPEDSRAVLWVEGRYGDRAHVLEPTTQIPGPSAAWVSPEGSVTVVRSGGSLYWAEGNDELELLAQPDSACAAVPASRDGRVVLSYCEEAGVQVIYRWTAETREFARFGAHDLPDPIQGFNADASVLAATTPFSSALLYLKAGGTRVVDSADERIELFGVSDDGSVVYLHQLAPYFHALRWSEAGGFVALESLPGLPCTELAMPDVPAPHYRRDLALGRSSGLDELVEGTCAWGGSRAVLWDAQGVRDIAAELTAAGVNLQGVSLRRADRYWVGSSIRLMGTGTLSSGALRTWIAELPPRD